MKFLIDNWFLILTALVSGGMLLWTSLSRAGAAGSISTAEAVRLINREKGVLIDVCEAEEFAAGHAAGSRNIPLATLADSKQLPSNKALPLILMCQSGARASRAAGMLSKLGYEKVLPVAGGLRAWREANLPVEKAGA